MGLDILDHVCRFQHEFRICLLCARKREMIRPRREKKPRNDGRRRDRLEGYHLDFVWLFLAAKTARCGCPFPRQLKLRFVMRAGQRPGVRCAWKDLWSLGLVFGKKRELGAPK